MSLISKTNKGQKMTTETELTAKQTQLVALDVRGYGTDYPTSIADIEELIANLRKQAIDKSREVSKIQQSVLTAFKDKFDGDKDATAEFDLEEANDLLQEIGADTIKFTYRAKVTIEVFIQGIEADSDEDAEHKALSSVSISFDASEAGEDAEVVSEEFDCQDVEQE
jgi:hypothetical protein